MSASERVLEPGAADAACEMAGGGFNSDHEAMVAIVAMSNAISLKRIADALTGTGDNILTMPLNSYGEGIGQAIQGQMVRGQMGVDRT